MPRPVGAVRRVGMAGYRQGMPVMSTSTIARLGRDVVAGVRGTGQQPPVSNVVAARRAGTPLVVSVLGVVGFAGLVALVRRKRSEAADLAITMKLQALRHPVLERLMAGVSWFGFPPQSRLIPPLLIGTQLVLRLRLEALMQLLAWGAAAASTVIKLFMRRPRPVAGTDLRVVAAELGGTSFPSGHVLSYVATYGWLSVVLSTLVRATAPRRMLVAALAGLIALVGPSRIYQGHHWATDVAASYLLGFSYLAALVALYRRLKARRPLA